MQNRQNVSVVKNTCFPILGVLDNDQRTEIERLENLSKPNFHWSTSMASTTLTLLRRGGALSTGDCRFVGKSTWRTLVTSFQSHSRDMKVIIFVSKSQSFYQRHLKATVLQKSYQSHSRSFVVKIMCWPTHSIPQHVCGWAVIRGTLSIRGEEQQRFGGMDTDQSGNITLDELGSYMQRNDPSVTVEQVQDRFDKLDGNGDGSVSMKEFVCANTFDLGVHGTIGESGMIAVLLTLCLSIMSEFLMGYIFAWHAAGSDIAAKRPPVDVEGWHVVLLLQKRQSTSWVNQRMVRLDWRTRAFELRKL